MPRCAWTSAAPVSPTASSKTSTCPKSNQDACEVIAWLAEQPWCSGAVGMIGHLVERIQQTAGGLSSTAGAEGHRHPCSTDDRYADDVHYTAASSATDMLQWAAVDARVERPAARSRDRR